MGHQEVLLLTKKLGALGSDISNKWINERRISEWQILSTGKQAEATLAQNLSALVSDKGIFSKLLWIKTIVESLDWGFSLIEDTQTYSILNETKNKKFSLCSLNAVSRTHKGLYTVKCTIVGDILLYYIIILYILLAFTVFTVYQRKLII